MNMAAVYKMLYKKCTVKKAYWLESHLSGSFILSAEVIKLKAANYATVTLAFEFF